tara:strand:- start:8797 stop:9117 length:321 start_codon:yes stop_codon:yes gene_type:complete
MKEYDETEHLLSTEANKERLLEDVFNDEKKKGVKELIDKQTLEEASWKHNQLKKLDGEFLRHAFKEGAKWQQERMYSEWDMREAYKYGKIYDMTSFEEWFNKFKKK